MGKAAVCFDSVACESGPLCVVLREEFALVEEAVLDSGFNDTVCAADITMVVPYEVGSLVLCKLRSFDSVMYHLSVLSLMCCCDDESAPVTVDDVEV